MLPQLLAVHPQPTILPSLRQVQSPPMCVPQVESSSDQAPLVPLVLLLLHPEGPLLSVEPRLPPAIALSPVTGTILVCTRLIIHSNLKTHDFVFAASIYSTNSTPSYGLHSTSPPTSRDSHSQSPPLGTESPNGVPIRIPSVPLDISTHSPHLRNAHASPHLGFSPYNSTPPPLSTSSSSSVSSLSSLSSYSSTHPQQPIMNSLNPINTYNIPPMSSLTGGIIHHPMSSLADDTYSHHQNHQSQHHYNFAPSKVWSSEPEDMGMGLGIVGLAPFVGAGSP